MSDQDRGAYTPPTDAPLSFDARQPVRGSRPVPITLIISAFVLVLLVVAIVVFYRSGVREAGQAPQAVGTPVGAIKTPPPADAQPADPAAGLQIYRSENGAEAPAAAPSFAAPPEQPQARPVAPPTPAPTAPVQAAPVAAAAPQLLPPAKPAAAAGLKPAQPTAPPPPPKPAPTAKIAPPKATPAPAPAPKAAAAPAPAPKAAPSPAGAAGVQIGAFSSPAQADEGFRAAAAIAPAAMTGKGKRVEPVQKGSATLYRTTVTGFASRADAQAFCDKLKAAGKSCFVK
jgi:cytoskeletal protein RodZ